jgi:hypothetical protein
MCIADSTMMNRIIRKDSLFNCGLRAVSSVNGESLIPLTCITSMSCTGEVVGLPGVGKTSIVRG